MEARIERRLLNIPKKRSQVELRLTQLSLQGIVSISAARGYLETRTLAVNVGVEQTKNELEVLLLPGTVPS